MKKLLFKKIIPIILMSAFWTTVSPIGMEQSKDSVNEAKAECDAYRKINANRDSVSVQSYRAKVNKERNANMVAQEQLSINEEQSMIMAYHITGLVVVLILLCVVNQGLKNVKAVFKSLSSPSAYFFMWYWVEIFV